MNRRTLLASLVVTGTTALAGCSGDDGTGTPTSSSSVSPTARPTDSPTEPRTDSPTPGPPEPVGTIDVTVRNDDDVAYGLRVRLESDAGRVVEEVAAPGFAPDSSVIMRGPQYDPGPYSFTFEVASDSATYEWRPAGCPALTL